MQSVTNIQTDIDVVNLQIHSLSHNRITFTKNNNKNDTNNDTANDTAITTPLLHHH